MSWMSSEIASQPAVWRRAAALGRELPAGLLPAPGERVALVGCGTSYNMAQAAAALREAAGQGETDAFAASEMPATRRYDAVVALSRSGTTTEVLRLLERLPPEIPTTVLSAVPGTPVVAAARRAIVLDFADERSVVQTRFATSALVLWRAWLGEDLEATIAAAERALRAPLPVEPGPPADGRPGHFVFLGRGWTAALASEAALKLREAARAWVESYPAMEYRHGPIAVAGPGTVVWALGTLPEGLAEDVAATGARVLEPDPDPMASLVLAQRLAAALAAARGLDPDHPRHLTRSVVLPSA
jgi:fructoselysine-6-P-deglycase FrlB-like protein